MKFPDPITHMQSHLSKEYFEQLRNTALSAAGFSAGIIILLAQTKGQGSYSEVALWAAIVSLVTWLFAWQYATAYWVHGERTYGHFNFILAALLTLVGLGALFTAVVATVWKLSVWAGIVLSALGLILSVAVFVHFQTVDKYCDEREG